MDYLALRKTIKGKKPKYSRQDSHKKPKLGDKWRKPKGIQSKMRLHKRGYKRSPEVGFGSPRAVKGLSRDGYEAISISSIEDIKKITDVKKQAAVIASSVGKRKRLDIISALSDQKIKILNLSQDYADKIKKELEQRKKLKESREKKKLAVKKELEKKAKQKEKEETENKEESSEEKLDAITEKEMENKEKEKIITKKD